MNLPSSILQHAVDQLSSLPGVGRRAALRFALHLMRLSDSEIAEFASSVTALKTDLHYCRLCHNVSDSEICPICSNPKRNHTLVCVVENLQDVLAIENTQQYSGLYHVLGGVISPIDGIGIRDLNIQSLIDRVANPSDSPVSEVILALPTTMEGDTTAFYINRQLEPLGVKVSAIARGIAIGDNLEYADEITLARSILHRIPFNESH